MTAQGYFYVSPKFIEFPLIFECQKANHVFACIEQRNTGLHSLGFYHIINVAIVSNCWQLNCDGVIAKMPKYIYTLFVEGDTNCNILCLPV
jgi:hypothetical protein